MSDPLSLLPLALAAGDGSVDGWRIRQLVAAGLTLLQRSAPVVRALAGRRAAILLPTSPQFLVALAAAEGHGVVLVNPLAAPADVAYQLRDANVGAVFTTAALASRLPEDVVRVLLDDAPRTAHVLSGAASRHVDLGSHFGLELEGDPGTPGSDEEAAIVYTTATTGRPLGAILTHRGLLANARATIEACRYTPDDSVLATLPFSRIVGLTVTASAPLLAGARVTTMARFDARRAAEFVASGEITAVAGVPATYDALLAAMEHSRGGVGALRLCICDGAPLARELQDRWFDATGVELRQGYGLTEAALCLFNRVDAPNARGTLGRPLPGVDVEIREGEICVRGENLFAGYVSGTDDGRVGRDGWLRTGDLGRANADGTVSFLGRREAMRRRDDRTQPGARADER